MFFLADTSFNVTPTELYAFLACVFALLGIVALWQKVFGQNPPLYKEYVSKAEHDKHRDEIKTELSRHAARRAEIYEEQKIQGEKLGRLEVATQHQNRDLEAIKETQIEMQNRIDAVPERTIQLLLDARKVGR